MSMNGDTCVMRNGRSTSKISIYDYPEHLNPFYEDENHKRLRFWKVGKNKNGESRRSSFSLDGLRDMWTFKSFRLKKKSSTLGINKTSESPPSLRRDISPTNQHYGTYDPKLRHTTNGFDRNVPYRSSLQDMRASHTIDRIGFNRNDRYRSTVQTQNPATGSGSGSLTRRYVYGGSVTPQPCRSTFDTNSENGYMSRGSSQSSVYSTNPFDEDDDNDVVVVPGSGKRPHRKKRRAPPPPTQVNQIKEESPSSEVLEISNLTAQIESFVNATNNDEDVKKPVQKKLPTPPPQIIVDEYIEPVIETEEKLEIVEEPRVECDVEVEVKVNVEDKIIKQNEIVAKEVVDDSKKVEENTNRVIHHKTNGAIPKDKVNESEKVVIEEKIVTKIEPVINTDEKIKSSLQREPVVIVEERVTSSTKREPVVIVEENIKSTKREPAVIVEEKVSSSIKREPIVIVEEKVTSESEPVIVEEKIVKETPVIYTNTIETTIVTPPRREKKHEKIVENEIIQSVNEQKVLNTDPVLIKDTKYEIPDTPQAQRKFVKEPSLTPSDDTNISVDLRICESKDDLTSDASDVSNCKVAYTPLKDSSPEPEMASSLRKPEIPAKPTNLENSASRYFSDDNLNESIYRKPSMKFKDLRSTSIENGPTTQRRSVKEIIESINKSQSLLKMNQPEQPQSADYNANQAFKTLEEREKEIKRMLEELDKPLNYNSNSTQNNKDLDDLVDSLNNNISTSNNDIFQKCVVKKTDMRQTREQSPTVSNLDWNPIPKPKRSKNFN